MTDKNPLKKIRRLRRIEASAYLKEKWGVTCTSTTLAKLASAGNGPVFQRDGRFVVYMERELDNWAKSRLCAPESQNKKLNKWKPIEKLKNPGINYYLIYSPSMSPSKILIAYKGKHKMWYDAMSEAKIKDPTHWQPLPDPPEGI